MGFLLNFLKVKRMGNRCRYDLFVCMHYFYFMSACYFVFVCVLLFYCLFGISPCCQVQKAQRQHANDFVALFLCASVYICLEILIHINSCDLVKLSA